MQAFCGFEREACASDRLCVQVASFEAVPEDDASDLSELSEVT